ncbi:MAG: right-handed parallel beta-helix repeat-containing protein [Thermoplasmata archaeon]|nr:right-handed parallel beta-helix repeat-containing protein [Thermoplasmata archaeon]
MKRIGLAVALLVFTSVFLFTLTILPDVKATTLYVGGAGPGNYTTIQSAIDDANPGDSVYVHSGTYYESITIFKTLSLIGEDRDTTVINGTATGDVVHVTADWVNVTGFTIANSGPGYYDSGIELYYVQNCNVAGSNFSNNEFGIYLYHSSSNRIASNNASVNKYGITLRYSVNNLIINNTASTNAQSGIQLWYSDNNTLSNNTALSNEVNGIDLGDSNNNTVANNSISDNWGGILIIDGSDRNTVVNNIAFSNNWSGINLAFSGNNTMAGNNLFANDVGIQIQDSHSNTIVSNKVSSNNWYGIYLDSSESNVITDNLMVEDGVYIGGDSLENWNSHTIDSSNTVNGKPVYYWKNVGGGTIPSDAGQVILANCTDVVIENQNVSNSSVGIELGFSSDNTIANNTANSNDRYGISLWHSDGNTITNHTSLYNEGGIDLWRSDGNIIANSVASNNNEGIRTYSSFDNRIYHNNLIGNARQAYDFNGDNDWDDGYPSGGNYWSDYAGVDQKSGPNQNEGGSDGIGDTPYDDISGGASQDRYPFVKPTLEFNNPPTASFTVTPPEGNTTTVFIMDASTSSDLEDHVTSLEFRWDCENDGTWDDFFMTSQCQYSTPGTYTIRLEVRDTGGRMDITTRQVIVRSIENQQPTCSISEPEQGDVLSENYTVIGTASDSDGVVEEVEIRIDDGPWIQVTGTSSWSYEWNTTDVSDGNHTIYARSYDGTDYSEEVSVTVVVDSVSPPPPAEEESVFEQAWFWITVAVVIVIILTVVLILVRRRKEKQGEGESPESG